MRYITQAPWYITNEDLRRNLRLDSVSEVIAKKTNKYIYRVHSHPNVEAIVLLPKKAEKNPSFRFN